MSADPLEEYPRQVARPRGCTLGAPRSFTVAPDGSRIVFLRSMAGDDPVSCLWVLDPATGEERCVFDPRRQGLGGGGGLSGVEGALRVRDLNGGNRVLAADDDPDTFWGLPEFAAAEEMRRLRGHWWSPD